MGYILGPIRIVLIALIIFFGTIIILIAGLTSWEPRGVPASRWVATYMSRAVNLFYRVRLTVTDPEAMANFHGFFVANHISYLDIISLYAVQPVRMMAAAEVKTRPILGWAASGAGAIFVDRSSLRSRRDAVQTVLDDYRAHQDPPIAIFVEGRMGTGERLFPFQLGIFKLAKREAIPYMPVAIVYDRPDIVVWHGSQGENMLQAAWRLATFTKPVHAKVIPLQPVNPTLEDNAAHLADAAQAAIAAAIGIPAVKHGQA